VALFNDVFAKGPVTCVKLANMAMFFKSCAKWTKILPYTNHSTGGAL
jgi:hypothetical protein